jgi:phenylalanyl-tRNA synthetase alpha chain
MVSLSLDYLNRQLMEESEALAAFCSQTFEALDERALEAARVRFLGKTSVLQKSLASLRDVAPADRKAAGALINEAKKKLETAFASFAESFGDWNLDRILDQQKVDLTLPVVRPELGSRHPVSMAMRELVEPLRRMGFDWIDGPEIESDFYNFEALNIPKEHPAREMQDTFFLSSDWLLRTQTSSVQAHALKERGVPLKIVCGGYTYRNEYDMTHVPTFRQLEALVVDKGIHFGHLRHTLGEFFKEFFGRPVPLRFRSSYFPFTEPSAEMDIQCQQCHGAGCRSCKHTGWLELGGCGLVNRKVLESCGIDSSVYSGFAFGMGVDRIAMSRFAVSDLRALYEGDVPFLRGFQLNT